MILKCAIVDDEPLALDLLESYVKRTPSLQLCGKYHSALEAMPALKESHVDLLFLDIQMPELDGISFSTMVGQDTRVVFTTAFAQYAIDGYKVNALDYLLKPISYEEFMRSVNKAMEWFMRTSPASSYPEPSAEGKSIIVKSDYKLVQIRLDTILYIEGLKDYVKIYLDSQQTPVVTLMSMKSLENALPSDSFMRVHRSFIVNTGKIRIIDRSRIVFGDTYVPVGDNYKEAFQRFLDSRMRI